jgi:two-component system, NarL family, sensor histidine kinase BarA
MASSSFQRVLGETSLERKCRFLFGISLFVLILGSFWWCAKETTNLVHENTRSNCRHLVETAIIKLHFVQYANRDPDKGELYKRMVSDSENLSYSARFIYLEGDSNSTSPSHLTPNAAEKLREKPHMTAPDRLEQIELAKLRTEYENRLQAKEHSQNGAVDPPLRVNEQPAIYETYKDKDSSPIWTDRSVDKMRLYHYYQVVDWKEGCVACHSSQYEISYSMNPSEAIRQMPFIVVKVELPHDNTRRAINKNYSFLLAIAILTVFLSMVSLYIVVRYVIVKPLQHLQSVSELVEKGNYDAQAQIETNDEFEQLAQAFNKMVRHLVKVQHQLQDSNDLLDAKVDQLAQANMQLYELNRLKSDFLANVSHELRTPLNSIIGFSDVLEGVEALNEKQKRYVTNIRSSGRSLLEMINDILDLAKLESGKMEARPSDFSLTAVLASQVEMMQTIAGEKNIDISIDAPPNLPPIFQDQARIQQIVTNLLSNAIKFTPDGGFVRVRVRTEPESDPQNPESLRLSVEDTGVGIAKEDREIIFDKFRQAAHPKGDNLTREYSGTGLGLSIVKELCKLLDGEISVESELGKGSIFTIRIPWHYHPPAPPPAFAPLETATTLSS